MRNPTYPEIDPTTWEHPYDKAALAALRRIPKLDELLQLTLGSWSESNYLNSNREQLQQVTEKNAPGLNSIYTDLLKTFDVQSNWPLYIKNEPGINAYAVGFNDPFVTLTIDAAQLEKPLLRMILAHEIGHLLAGHGLYRTMLRFLLSVGWLSGVIPVKIPIYLGVTLAMLEWRRCSEFTADRASALAAGGAEPVVSVLNLFDDPETPFRPMMQSINDNIPEFMRPVIQDSLNGIRKLTQTHPDPNIRISELRNWCASPEFEAIRRGEYPKRGESNVTVWQNQLQSEFGRLADDTTKGLKDIWNNWNPF